MSLKTIKLYGEMHRFIPIYASWFGAKKVTEIQIVHRPRIHGASKYGLEHVLKIVLDLLVVQFLANYATKSVYIFSGFGIAAIGFSFLQVFWLFISSFLSIDHSSKRHCLF